MKRAFFHFGVVALLSALLVPSFGCKHKTAEEPEEVAQTASNVNYSMAEGIEVPFLKSRLEFSEFSKASEIAVVKFGAEWCPPCKKLDPELTKIAGYFQTENVKIAQVDVEQLSDLASELKIESIPYCCVFYNGNYYTEIVGYAPDQLASLIESLCQGEAAPAEPKDDDDIELDVADDRAPVAEENAAEPEEADATLEEADAEEAEEEEEEVTDPFALQFSDAVYFGAKPVTPTELTSKEEFEAFIANNKYVVVDFSAEWCIWCKRLHPLLVRMGGFLGADCPELKLAEVDSDKVVDVKKELGVNGIPHTFLYRDGQPYTNIVGCDPPRIFACMSAMVAGQDVPAEEDEAAEEEEEEAEDEVVEIELDEEAAPEAEEETIVE